MSVNNNNNLSFRFVSFVWLFFPFTTIYTHLVFGSSVGRLSSSSIDDQKITSFILMMMMMMNNEEKAYHYILLTPDNNQPRFFFDNIEARKKNVKFHWLIFDKKNILYIRIRILWIFKTFELSFFPHSFNVRIFFLGGEVHFSDWSCAILFVCISFDEPAFFPI